MIWILEVLNSLFSIYCDKLKIDFVHLLFVLLWGFSCNLSKND